MTGREPVTASTLLALSRELSGLPVNAELAARHAATFEPLMAAIETLRKLPLKDLAPPLVFAPEAAEEAG